MYTQLQPSAVRDALEAIRRAVPLNKTHPLFQFVSLGGAEAIIAQRLLRLIRTGLNHQRRLVNEPPAAQHEPPNNIQRDFQHSNSELEAWSLLYFRYVRTDYDLSIEQLESLVQRNRRLLDRRQGKGINRLTYILIHREGRYRERERAATLVAMLPSPVPPRLFGRLGEFDQALTALNREMLPHHVILFGAAGIGKSALALALAHNFSQKVENLVWIEHPAVELDMLLEQIKLRLHLSPTHPLLSTYFQMVDTLIVIDSAEKLSTDLTARLLKLLGAARVILCRETLPTLSVDFTPVPLYPLSKEDAFLLLENQPNAAGFEPEHLMRLYTDLGGNPAALRMAIGASRRYKPTVISLDLYQRTWKRISEITRLQWFVLSLCPGGMAIMADLTIMTDSDPSPDLFEHWIVTSGDTAQIALTELANRFAESNPDLGLLTRAVQMRAGFLTQHPDSQACCLLLERAQESELAPGVLIDLAYAFEPIITRSGQWVAWRAFLEKLMPVILNESRSWLLLQLGVALQQTGALTESIAHLTKAMERLGEEGKFVEQADTLLVLARIYQLRGQPDRFEPLFNRAETVYRHYEHTDGLISVTAARLQAMLDAREIDRAWNHLESLHFDPLPDALCAIAARVALRSGHLTDARYWAYQAYSTAVAANDSGRVARLLTLLAECQVAQGDLETAIATLRDALNQMERQHDVIGYARGSLNLAALYLQSGDLDMALIHLKPLPAIFERLSDPVSLQTALANIALIEQARGKR
jgi:tetratricopeptide (TPR) repeat protein